MVLSPKEDVKVADIVATFLLRLKLRLVDKYFWTLKKTIAYNYPECLKKQGNTVSRLTFPDTKCP